MVKIHLISFASPNVSGKTVSRFAAQAKRAGVFATINVFNVKALSREFRKKHRTLLRRNVRGFGFWIWKPQLILQALRSVPEGDWVLYADIGCHISPEKHSALDYFVKTALGSEVPLLGFRLEDNDVQWSKLKLRNLFKEALSLEEMEQGQIAATVLLVQNSRNAVDFVTEWNALGESDHGLIDDTTATLDEDETFIEHRHDQSTLSLLGKQYKVAALPAEWTEGRRGPIEVRRDRDPSLTSLLFSPADLFRVLRERRKATQNWAYRLARDLQLIKK